MANTRTSAKRARQSKKKHIRNQSIRSSTRTTLRVAMNCIQKKQIKESKESYLKAVQALGKASSKGAIPPKRASRRISRLTLLAKKLTPEILVKT
jgi:small subunit ribosomal protein S20